MEAKDIIVGHTYRAKKPKAGVGGKLNDRYVLWIGGFGNVQYDGPTVKMGANYPTVPMEKFLKWAGSDVTEEVLAEK